MELNEESKKATYQKIKEYVRTNYGLSVSTLYIAQIKEKCDLNKGQHYNLSQKRKSECGKG